MLFVGSRQTDPAYRLRQLHELGAITVRVAPTRLADPAGGLRSSASRLFASPTDGGHTPPLARRLGRRIGLRGRVAEL